MMTNIRNIDEDAWNAAESGWEPNKHTSGMLKLKLEWIQEKNKMYYLQVVLIHNTP